MNSHFQFGQFEFDAAQLVLRREGNVVRLQAQPARVLACLLERRDRVVSRDELREAVWGNGTFVEFDAGLNFCIAQIRSALGDDAASPLYIRTVPKLGYQFVAPVESPSRPAPRNRLIVAAVALAACILVGFVGGFELRSRWAPGPLPIVAVARFDNESGNPDLAPFALGLTDNVVERLMNASNGRYTVTGNARILAAPRSQRDLLAIATSLHAKYIVIGQVKPEGLILAHLIRLPEQTHLWVKRLNHVPEGEMAGQISADFSARVAADIRNGYSSPGLKR